MSTAVRGSDSPTAAISRRSLAVVVSTLTHRPRCRLDLLEASVDSSTTVGDVVVTGRLVARAADLELTAAMAQTKADTDQLNDEFHASAHGDAAVDAKTGEVGHDRVLWLLSPGSSTSTRKHDFHPNHRLPPETSTSYHDRSHSRASPRCASGSTSSAATSAPRRRASSGSRSTRATARMSVLRSRATTACRRSRGASTRPSRRTARGSGTCASSRCSAARSAC